MPDVAPGAGADWTRAPYDPTDWRQLTLHLMGCDPTAPNAVVGLQLWADSEGMPADTYNWLAATDARPGSGIWNADGVRVYPSMAVGAQVLADKFSSALYRPIHDALCAGRSLAEIWTAVNRSPWCGGCQGGTYPNVLYKYLHGQVSVLDTPMAGAGGQHSGGSPSPSWDHQVRATAGEIRGFGGQVHPTWVGLEDLYRRR